MLKTLIDKSTQIYNARKRTRNQYSSEHSALQQILQLEKHSKIQYYKRFLLLENGNIRENYE